MNRIFSILILLMAILVPSYAMAQRGEKSLGIMGGYNTRSESAVAGIYFQYRCGQLIRLAPDLQYVIKHDGVNAYQFNANVHFVINLGQKVNFYPLAGVTFQSWRFNAQEISKETKNYLGVNGGAGIEYMATSTLKVFFEGKYSWIKNLPSGTFAIGLGYCF